MIRWVPIEEFERLFPLKLGLLVDKKEQFEIK